MLTYGRYSYLRPPSWMFCELSSHTPTAPRQDLRVEDGGGAELRTASSLGAGTRTGTWGCFQELIDYGLNNENKFLFLTQ